MSRVYLDHNATSPLRDEVRAILIEALERHSGNASSVHQSGREARQALDEARERTADALGVSEDEIVFTSGGTEADNLALFGVLRPLGTAAALVTTEVEHSAILAAADVLEASGHPVHRVRVQPDGVPDPADVVRATAESGAPLVSVMAVNNETGSCTDLAALRAALDAEPDLERPTLHTDAVQALGRIPVELRAWGVDLASFSVHKVGGPLGVGVLYRRKGLSLESLLHGGAQETGMRPGTENVPAIVAASHAVQIAVEEQREFAARCRDWSRLFWSQVREFLPGTRLVGPPIDSERRAPNTLNLMLPDVDGRVLVTRLDLEGLEVSAGSACASGSLEPSHVLLAMGYSEDEARAGLRISFGHTTTERDIHTAVEILRRTKASSR